MSVEVKKGGLCGFTPHDSDSLGSVSWLLLEKLSFCSIRRVGGHDAVQLLTSD